MKVASTLLAVTLSVTAVSAFGLHTGTTNVVKNMAPFQKKAMVQPVDVHGNRLSSVVSQLLLQLLNGCASGLQEVKNHGRLLNMRKCSSRE
jgi:hypothetical protein